MIIRIANIYIYRIDSSHCQYALLSLLGHGVCDSHEKRLQAEPTRRRTRTITGYLILRHGGQRLSSRGLPGHLSFRQTAFTEFYCSTSGGESQLKVPRAVESRHSNPADNACDKSPPSRRRGWLIASRKVSHRLVHTYERKKQPSFHILCK